MPVLSTNYSLDSFETITIKTTTANSYTFNTSNNGIDVAVTNGEIYASAASQKANSIAIDNQGISISGSGELDFNIGLGINNTTCNMVNVEGQGSDEVALQLYEDRALLSGQSGKAVLTVFTDALNEDEYSFDNPLGKDVLIKCDSGVAGDVDVLISSKNDGVYDVSLLKTDVTGITLNSTALSMNYKATAKLTATVTPDNATNKAVTWKSDNEKVATVDADGNVKAVGRGTAKITATTEDGQHTATCEVKIKYAWWQWLIVIFLFGWIWY